MDRDEGGGMGAGGGNCSVGVVSTVPYPQAWEARGQRVKIEEKARVRSAVGNGPHRHRSDVSNGEGRVEQTCR